MNTYTSVLLVDDDPTQIALLRAYFAGLKVPNIYSATNSAYALKIMKDLSGKLDLIVTDLQMPGMDGLEFMRHLNRLAYSGKLAIISGVKDNLLDHASRLARMHQLDLIGSVSKPLRKNALDAMFLRDKTNAETIQKTDTLVITQEDFACALANNEIVPYYQPKVDVQSGRIVGAEALARWFSPGAGNISPEIFIKFAEENGRIDELTFYLFEKAIIDTKRFLQYDPELKIAINLAPEMINNIALPDRLCERMQFAGITSKNISFEVTENSILNLKPETLEVLSRLRINDFDIAIDDFGTGSSNIQTLRDFPFSELKIDRSFISNATVNSFSRETVHAAIMLARQQDMKIVAEGVEDLETLEFIQLEGIEHAQGFLIARAICADDFCQFLLQHQNSQAIKVA